MIKIAHKFVSGKADGGDATLVRPSNWNDVHGIALDPNLLHIADHFFGGTTTSSSIGALGWANSAIGAAATVSGQAGVNPNLGILRLTTSGTSGQGSVFSLGLSSVAPLGDLGSNTNWELTWKFRLGQTTACRMRVGLVGNFAVSPSNGIWLRYDTNAGDTAFTVETRASSTSTTGATTYTVDTNFHTIRIWSTAAGQINFSFDGGATQTLSTNVPTAGMFPAVVFTNDAAATKFIELDAFEFLMSF